MRATVLSCVIMALISMAIGLSIYGSNLFQQYITRASNTAESASLSVKHGQPETKGLVEQVMGIYRSLTPEQQLKMASSDPKEREEYRSYFASIETGYRSGSIYDILFHMLPSFQSDVAYVYLGMYDMENSRLVFIVDPDKNEAQRRMPGDWEYVSQEEARSFLEWDGEGILQHISRTAGSARPGIPFSMKMA